MVFASALLVMAVNCFSGTQHPPTAILRPTYEELGLPIYRQTGPWCWAYTSNSVAEYEYARALDQGKALSTGYLAWAAKETDVAGSGGSNFGRAARGLQEFGVAPLASFGEPGEDTSLSKKPPIGVLERAKSDAEVQFKWIRFWSRESITSEQFETIKGEISSGHPVAVGMLWPKDVKFLPGTQLLVNPGPTGVQDGHCVILCGYWDDSRVEGGGYFAFRNSWGSEWVDHGYGYMPYGLLKACLNDAFSMRIAARLPEPANMQAIFVSDLVNSASLPERTQLQPMKRFGNAWGSNQQLVFFPSTNKKDLALTFDAPKAGSFKVLIRCTTAEDYGRFAVSVNGVAAKQLWDGASAGVSLARPFFLGTFKLSAGNNKIIFVHEGRSAASRGDLLGVHEIEVSPVE